MSGHEAAHGTTGTAADGRPRQRRLLAASLVLVLLAGCGSDADDDAGSASPEDFIEVEEAPDGAPPDDAAAAGDAADGADGADGADDADDADTTQGPDDDTEQPDAPDLAEVYGRWSQVAVDETINSLMLVSVAATPAAVVAVGWDQTGFEGAVVFSTDSGRTWSRAALEDSAATTLWAVVGTDEGFVVVGDDAERGSAAAWTSSDGQAWQRAPHDEAAFGGSGRQRMFGLALGGPGLVAVGEDEGRNSAAVWTTPDGRSWERVTPDDPVFAGDGLFRMVSVTAGGPGFVAVGDDFEVDGVAVWTSTDGVSWQRVPHDAAVFGEDGLIVVDEVVTGARGLVAVGRHFGNEGAVVWTSVDGLRWERLAHDERVFGGPDAQSMQGVASIGVGAGYVAVGYDRGQGSPAVWVSADGTSWQRLALDPSFASDDAEMMAVAVTGTGLVAVGHLDFAETGIWTSP